jgi:hypothetical protein
MAAVFVAKGRLCSGIDGLGLIRYKDADLLQRRRALDGRSVRPRRHPPRIGWSRPTTGRRGDGPECAPPQRGSPNGAGCFLRMFLSGRLYD